MISVTDVAEEFNAIPAAKVNNSNNEWDGAESHYYSPTLAKEVGREEAIVLRELAWKVRRSKNDWNGGKGYYETLENLAKLRFPYWCPATIFNITTELEEKKVLKRGSNNKRSYDRTTWYSMSDEMIRRALDDDGALGFDVKVAMTHEMPEALAFHHVRFHLRQMIAKEVCREDLFHKVNKSSLARSWNIDVATVRRAFGELVVDGLLEKHLTNSKYYSIPEIRASVNENRASVNEASVNETRAAVNRNRASVNENRAFVSDNTHYEAIRKPFRNHSNNGGGASLNGEPCKSQHSSPVATSSACQDISMKHDSSTIPVQETAKPGANPLTQTRSSVHQRLDDMMDISSFRIPATFDELKTINKELIPTLTNFTKRMGQERYDGVLLDQCEYLLSILSHNDIDTYLAASKTSEVMVGLIERFRGILEAEIEGLAEWAKVTTEEFWPLVFYPGLEIISLAFRTKLIAASKHGTSIPDHHLLVEQLSDKITESRLADVSSSVDRKVTIFRETVELRNRDGWSFSDETEVKNAVCLTSPYLKQIGRLFELNPHLAPGPLVEVLWECIWWSRQEKPSTGDKHYWSRLGCDLGTFCRKLDLIVGELGMREVCPVTQL